MRRVPSVGGALMFDLISRAESREWVQRVSERQLRSRLEQIHDKTRYVASAKHSIGAGGPFNLNGRGCQESGVWTLTYNGNLGPSCSLPLTNGRRITDWFRHTMSSAGTTKVNSKFLMRANKMHFILQGGKDGQTGIEGAETEKRGNGLYDCELIADAGASATEEGHDVAPHTRVIGNGFWGRFPTFGSGDKTKGIRTGMEGSRGRT